MPLIGARPVEADALAETEEVTLFGDSLGGSPDGAPCAPDEVYDPNYDAAGMPTQPYVFPASSLPMNGLTPGVGMNGVDATPVVGTVEYRFFTLSGQLLNASSTPTTPTLYGPPVGNGEPVRLSLTTWNNTWSGWTALRASDSWHSWNVAWIDDEEREEVQAAHERAVLRQQARELKAQQDREAAEARAEALLHENLDSVQREDLEKKRYFHVRAKSGRWYRICVGVAGNVYRIENGREVEKFCIHPPDSYPTPDVMLAQKLLLEADEDAFRRTANITPMRAA